MKWIVINFDEDSKLYTVQDESGRVCRANTDAVVYGVKGGKLRSIPSYADQVLTAISVYSLFKGKEINTTDFGSMLLMEIYIQQVLPMDVLRQQLKCFLHSVETMLQQ